MQQLAEKTRAPRPLQGTSVPGSPANGIPMWVAGGGEKVTLKIAAQYADYTNVFGDLAEFTRKNEILKEHCRTVGRDESEIVRSINVNVFIGETEVELQDRLDWYLDQRVRACGLQEAVVRREIDGLRGSVGCGTPDQVVERLTALRDAGLGYTIAYFADAAYDTTSIDLFERAVIPELKG